ncbi:hypothetical protein NDU88_011267 [Pleurodeles waltl]|uniref:Uncharacterized protein n=1 Tax=Pleurodeles waltl TaxID=8319 RepID=A0AAV7S0M0_PLEWA|nr:hypothetical protein NDU88_011267 [Pleurodeles waltl]
MVTQPVYYLFSCHRPPQESWEPGASERVHGRLAGKPVSSEWTGNRSRAHLAWLRSRYTISSAAIDRHKSHGSLGPVKEFTADSQESQFPQNGQGTGVELTLHGYAAGILSLQLP